MKKPSLSDDSVLGYYEVGLDTQLVVDAGPKGIGLVLLKRKPGGWQPVACHSRQLTDTEQRYSQIERECLAVRWACEKCYNFLIGSRFTILTDHKPLIPILNNPLSRPPLRIEKWLMFLQQFDYEAVHIPGKTNAADYLSRHSLAAMPSDEKASEKREEVVFSLVRSCSHPGGDPTWDSSGSQDATSDTSHCHRKSERSESWQWTNTLWTDISGTERGTCRSAPRSSDMYTGIPAGRHHRHMPWGTSRNCEVKTTVTE